MSTVFPRKPIKGLSYFIYILNVFKFRKVSFLHWRCTAYDIYPSLGTKPWSNLKMLRCNCAIFLSCLPPSISISMCFSLSLSLHSTFYMYMAHTMLYCYFDWMYFEYTHITTVSSAIQFARERCFAFKIPKDVHIFEINLFVHFALFLKYFSSIMNRLHSHTIKNTHTQTFIQPYTYSFAHTHTYRYKHTSRHTDTKTQDDYTHSVWFEIASAHIILTHTNTHTNSHWQRASPSNMVRLSILSLFAYATKHNGIAQQSTHHVTVCMCVLGNVECFHCLSDVM